MQKRVKMGGRQKGTPNKSTQQMKDVIKTLINEDLLPCLKQDIQELTAYERTKLLTSLLRYYMPTMSAQTDTEGQDVPIIIIEKGI
jgi:hypothetical protein